MTVLELIAQLEQLPGSAEVYAVDDSTEEPLAFKRVELMPPFHTDGSPFVALYVDLDE